MSRHSPAPLWCQLTARLTKVDCALERIRIEIIRQAWHRGAQPEMLQQRDELLRERARLKREIAKARTGA